jgi:hypothetical protein
MNPELISALIALLGAIGAVIAAIASYRNSKSASYRNKIESELEILSSERNDKIFGVDAAERLGNLSLNFLENLQGQLKLCVSEKSELKKENYKLKEAFVKIRPILIQIVKTVEELASILIETENTKTTEIGNEICKSASEVLDILDNLETI